MCVCVLKPVHTGDYTGDYSRRFRRQFVTVAENSDCRRKRRLSQKSATVAEFGDCRRCITVFGDSCRFLRHSHFSALRQSPFSATVALFCDSVDGDGPP